ncbi:ATP-binding cassette domain-containing protein [Candidatus Bathyarchaeota archaeon]|nr:ATP-binding cassette domain-containing protein [Candidatus Bathyarchaeota archaeon]
MYQLKDVLKSYGSVSALNGINLSIGDEFLGIIGHSGVGKTTLLKILAGLEAPTGGVLYFNDKPITQSNRVKLRKSVTMIFQTPVFLRGDVYTNIAYGLRLRGKSESEIEEKVESVLNTVRLSGLSSRDTRELSGGEQQRVALARSLVLDPEVMLLDEPTSNLDPGNVSIINDILLEESEKRVMIIATHDLAQVSKITDRVVFMENGVISEDGAPEVLEALTRYTENIFTGFSEHIDGVSTIDIGEIEIKFTKPAEGRVSLHVRPQDIFLSNDWVETSARNQFRGSIVGVEGKNGVVLVSVDVGVVFRVQITRKSFDEMGLELGKVVNISFKASSVLLL